MILPDVRGLYPSTPSSPSASPQAGHHAIAFDYFGRTAGLGPRDEEFEYMPHVRQTRPRRCRPTPRRRSPRCASGRAPAAAVTVGFCFGGTQSFLASTNPALDLDGAVGFYGGLNPERWGDAGPIARAGDMHGPLLGLYGGADEGIPPDQIEAFEQRLAAAGVDHEIVVYPGAPHSFFDRRFEEHAEACGDAWRRVLGFLQRG